MQSIKKDIYDGISRIHDKRFRKLLGEFNYEKDSNKRAKIAKKSLSELEKIRKYDIGRYRMIELFWHYEIGLMRLVCGQP